MKRKTKTTSLKICFLFFCILSFKITFSQDRYSEEQVSKMLKTFYTEYLTESCNEKNDIEKTRQIIAKYGTDKLLVELKNPEIDYDILLNSNTCDVEWLKTLVVKKDSAKNNVYYVTWDWYDGSKRTVQLYIIKVMDSYKIDCVYFEISGIECPCTK